MATQLPQGAVVVSTGGTGMRPGVAQAAVIASVTFTPAVAPIQMVQGAVVYNVRNYEVVKSIEQKPIVYLPHLCACLPVPFFTYEGN